MFWLLEKNLGRWWLNQFPTGHGWNCCLKITWDVPPMHCTLTHSHPHKKKLQPLDFRHPFFEKEPMAASSSSTHQFLEGMCLTQDVGALAYDTCDGSRWAPTRSISYNPTYTRGPPCNSYQGTFDTNMQIAEKKNMFFWGVILFHPGYKRDDSKLDLETIGWRGPTKRWGS